MFLAATTWALLPPAPRQPGATRSVLASALARVTLFLAAVVLALAALAAGPARVFVSGGHRRRGGLGAKVARAAVVDEAGVNTAQLNALFGAYDEDSDGVLNAAELRLLAADTGGSTASWARPLAEELAAPGAVWRGEGAPGVSRAQLGSRYAGRPRSLGRDYAAALEPRVEGVVVLGAAALVTLLLARVLRRRLLAVLGNGRKVTAAVGHGATRVQPGWFLVGGNPSTDAAGTSFQFLDETKDAASLQGLAQNVVKFSASGAVDEMTFLPLSSNGEAPRLRPTGASNVFIEEGSKVPQNITDLLASVRAMLPWARRDDEAERAARAADEARKRKALEPLLRRLAKAAAEKEPETEADDDIASVYKSVRDFKVLKEGDPAYVPMETFQGNAEVRAQLVELVDLVKAPERYAKVGAKAPKGVLLCGEPGTGKTFAARAVASAAGVPFLAISGSDFRQSPFSGVGTSMTLKMFDEARKQAPCIIFIDEIDSLGEARRQGPTAFLDAGEMGGSVTRDQDANLNALLAKMDGFQPSAGVLFLAATNRPEVLDEALLRAGRFDRRIEFRLPSLEGRQQILRGYAGDLAFEPGSPDFANLAKQTPAFSPADLQGLLNSAATAAARAGRDNIVGDDLDASLLEVRRRKAKARPEGAFQVTEVVEERLANVRGHDEAVQELRELLDALVDREKYAKVGAVPPRGALLEGPPGVGKTHCARALAGEIGLPFLSASGSDFQASRFAGQGTQLVKRLFALAKKLQPCVVFIDELDALGRRREASARGAEQDRENTLMQLLVEMDGFEERSDVLVIAATNRSDVLDPALLRPGRFDRRIALELPDQRGRRSVLDLYVDKKPLAPDVDLDEVARRTVGFSGADLRNLLNEAALLAAKRSEDAIRRECIFQAADRTMLGIQKANPQRSERARRLTAIHEAGHAALGLALEALTNTRVARVSIRPRTGGIGGVTIFEPAEEGAKGVLPRGIYTKQGCVASLCVDLGGRVAEEMLLPALEVSSGASGDLQSATRRAMAMVTDWGLNDSVLSLSALGRSCSDATLREAELGASALLSQALGSARAVLGSEEGRRFVEQLSERLLEVEEVEAEGLLDAEGLGRLRALAEMEANTWA